MKTATDKYRSRKAAISTRIEKGYDSGLTDYIIDSHLNSGLTDHILGSFPQLDDSMIECEEENTLPSSSSEDSVEQTKKKKREQKR